MPVGIVPVGAGPQASANGFPKETACKFPPARRTALKPIGDHEWECDGVLFSRMVARMKGAGARRLSGNALASGESNANQADATRTLPGDKYQEYLTRIITTSRKEVGWELPWLVARATYHGPADQGSPDIRAAQNAMWDSHIALQGPDTDTLTGNNRDHGGREFISVI